MLHWRGVSFRPFFIIIVMVFPLLGENTEPNFLNITKNSENF